MKNRASILILSGSLLTMSSPFAASTMFKSTSAEIKPTETEEDETVSPQPRRLSGKVVDLRRVQSQDSTADNYKLTIAVSLDRSYHMDIVVNAGGQPIEAGDSVSITGQLDVRGQEVIFVPKTLYTEGSEKYDVQQGVIKLTRAPTAGAGEDDMKRIKGQLDWFQSVSIQGADDDDEIIRIQYTDGKSDLVNLGKGPQEFKLGLEKGEVIEVVGLET